MARSGHRSRCVEGLGVGIGGACLKIRHVHRRIGGTDLVAAANLETDAQGAPALLVRTSRRGWS